MERIEAPSIPVCVAGQICAPPKRYSAVCEASPSWEGRPYFPPNRARIQSRIVSKAAGFIVSSIAPYSAGLPVLAA